jgi:toxin ParE1/3/4
MPDSYRLSVPADDDLDHIIEYTVETFGVDQAIKYAQELHSVFEKLTRQEMIGIERNEIARDQRSIVHNKHIVFYHIDPKENVLHIDCIIHGSRDLSKEFKISQ